MLVWITYRTQGSVIGPTFKIAYIHELYGTNPRDFLQV